MGTLVPGALLAAALAAVGALLADWGGRSGARAVRWGGLLLLAAASARLILWESYPDLFGNVMAPFGLRAVGYGLTIGGWYWAARGRRPAWAEWGAATFLTLWWLIFEVTHHFDNHRGRWAGAEGLFVAAVFSLYGLALAAAERRFSHMVMRLAARLLLAAGLVFLVAGALVSNARWALVGYRYFTYMAVFGSVWGAEALFARYGDDNQVQGLASLAALVCGFGVALFEVTRFLEPVFTFPVGELRTDASWAWETAIRTNWLGLAWGLYAAAAMAGAGLARSLRGRLLAAALSGVALVTAGYGAWQTAAPLSLRAAAVAAAAGGGALSAWLAGRGDWERHPREPLVRRALWLGSGAVVVIGLIAAFL